MCEDAEYLSLIVDLCEFVAGSTMDGPTAKQTIDKVKAIAAYFKISTKAMRSCQELCAIEDNIKLLRTGDRSDLRK